MEYTNTTHACMYTKHIRKQLNTIDCVFVLVCVCMYVSLWLFVHNYYVRMYAFFVIIVTPNAIYKLTQTCTVWRYMCVCIFCMFVHVCELMLTQTRKLIAKSHASRPLVYTHTLAWARKQVCIKLYTMHVIWLLHIISEHIHSTVINNCHAWTSLHMLWAANEIQEFSMCIVVQNIIN